MEEKILNNEEQPMNQNKLWFHFFNLFFNENYFRNVNPTIVGDIVNDELDKIFTLPDSYVKAAMPTLRDRAYTDMVDTVFSLLIFGLPIAIALSFGIGFALSHFFKWPFIETSLVIFSLYALYSIFGYEYKNSLKKELISLDKQRWSICWNSPEKLALIQEFLDKRIKTK